MKRHALDPISMFFGLLFAGLAISLMAGGSWSAFRRVAIVWPLALVVLGLALATSGVRRHEHRHRLDLAARQSQTYGPPSGPAPGRGTHSGPPAGGVSRGPVAGYASSGPPAEQRGSTPSGEHAPR